MSKPQTDTGLVEKDANGTVRFLALERDAYADLTHPKPVVVLLRRGILGKCCGHNLMLSCLRAMSIGRSTSRWDVHLVHGSRLTKVVYSHR
jgi:hypothetical protein